MARAFLERKGIQEARLEAELLVAHALGVDRMGLFLDLQRPVGGREIDFARDLLVRRGRREPLAYITGEREFYGRVFRVGPGVLVPRPETELLVDQARELLRDRPATPPVHVLDVGTGSGCLAVTLALELAGSAVTALDLSATALVCTRTNAEALGAEVRTLLGDGPEAAREAAPFDLIVSNPPYVDPADRDSLAPEIRDHEPPEALFAPDGDPDHWAQRLLDSADSLLLPGGWLLVELGLGQGERVQAAAIERGFDARVEPDLEGIPRVLLASRAGHVSGTGTGTGSCSGSDANRNQAPPRSAT